ncbi:hypothetical protein C161_22359 [Paenibacillus sp. FSL R5-192]|uniref:hypothetical protein n=1 Tax=Paenibacillus sp. FSL R5-192 TaxID=1226754 RepID=UPI0003E23B2C|nr:hypothetical protein [Paenibacillus sp. FSL R5-192]ETT32751.1 hypothetical protein C161_22359 [Paenibacillus sp. FSL R5-192]
MKKITSFTAVIAAISLLLSAPPTLAAKSNELSLIENYMSADQLDRKTQQLLSDELVKLVGKQNIQFIKIDTSFDPWVINGTIDGTGFADFTQRYDPDTNHVASTLIMYDTADLNKVMDNALLLKLDAFLKTFEDEDIFIKSGFWRFKANDQDHGHLLQNYWVIFGPSQQLYIDVDKDNQMSAILQYKTEDSYAWMTNIARNSLKTLGIPSVKAFDYTLFTVEGKDMLWQYRDDDNLNYVHIGSKTGKVWKVTNELGINWKNDVDFKKSFAKPKLSKNKALSIAVPTVRSIFGIELKGYSVRIQENEYTFTKKGATTLIGKINTKGAFYSFEAIPSKGVRN